MSARTLRRIACGLAVTAVVYVLLISPAFTLSRPADSNLQTSTERLAFRLMIPDAFGIPWCVAPVALASALYVWSIRGRG